MLPIDKVQINISFGHFALSIYKALNQPKGVFMTTLLILTAIVMSGTAMSAEVLLKYTKGSGFSPRPSTTILEVKDNGEITRVTQSQNKSEKIVPFRRRIN